MMLVDGRAGSKELAPILRARGMPVTVTRLDYGDVAWLGIGPGGEPVSVGVEVKQIRDVLQCVCDGRFAGHQLPGLVQAYESIYLLIIGPWRANAKTGLLQYRVRKGTWADISVGTRTFMFRDLLAWMSTIEIKGGIRSARMSDLNEATIWLSSLYNWWTQDGGWESHKSHLVFHDGTRHGAPYQRERATRMVASLADKGLLIRPTLCRMVAAQLPNVGWTRSAPIAKKFPTVEDLVMASPEELKVDGVGAKIAEGIWQSLRSRR